MKEPKTKDELETWVLGVFFYCRDRAWQWRPLKELQDVWEMDGSSIEELQKGLDGLCASGLVARDGSDYALTNAGFARM